MGPGRSFSGSDHRGRASRDPSGLGTPATVSVSPVTSKFSFRYTLVTSKLPQEVTGPPPPIWPRGVGAGVCLLGTPKIQDPKIPSCNLRTTERILDMHRKLTHHYIRACILPRVPGRGCRPPLSHRAAAPLRCRGAHELHHNTIKSLKSKLNPSHGTWDWRSNPLSPPPPEKSQKSVDYQMVTWLFPRV